MIIRQWGHRNSVRYGGPDSLQYTFKYITNSIYRTYKRTGQQKINERIDTILEEMKTWGESDITKFTLQLIY